MFCRACGERWGPLCEKCRGSLRPGGERRLECGLLVRSAFAHDGAARMLVHNIKYRGVAAAALLLAEAMAQLLPASTEVLAPVPRVGVRLWRHGIDPAGVLASTIGRITGLPTVECLRRPLWWPARAGPAGRNRGAPGFRALHPAGPRAVLIDDVMTTGTTLAAARRAVPAVRLAVTATGRAESGGSR